MDQNKQIIAYFGGGIWAIVDLYLLYQLDHKHLALHDASLSEWAQDNALPMETG